MTEAEWLTADDPHDLLQGVREVTSERKSRLFACACCRRVRHLLTDPRSWQAVEVAERYADGDADLVRTRTGSGGIHERQGASDGHHTREPHRFGGLVCPERERRTQACGIQE